MSIKTYLIIVSVMLITALGFGVYVWYLFQTVKVETVQTEPEKKIESEKISGNTDNPGESVTVEEGQLTVTPEVIRCIEDALGKERFDEIVAGSAPGPLESMELLACLKQ